MSELHLYNTLSKQKEKFVPINPGKVGMYTCGPTVYDYVHIGNLRSYVSADLLARYLKVLGYEVKLIKNITDVGHLTDDDIAQGDSGEDKMLKRAREEKKDPYEIARFYENAALEAEQEIGIVPAQYFPRATEHIPHMIRLIEALITKGHAYENNGNVFLDVTTFPDYGKLSGNTLENLNIGARLTEPHPDKKNQWDFALWLKASPEHLMQWDSPWSRGYPGWHIECSAMSTEYLGETFDIHTGGEDNIFPHHEAEIAQTTCALGSDFVRYWIHTRHLLVDGKKMSKSTGNFYRLDDITQKGYSAMDLRMLYLMSHYRSQMNFTWDALEQAKKNRETIERFFFRIKNYTWQNEIGDLQLMRYKQGFESSMDDDLNTPLALTTILSMIKEANRMMDSGDIIVQKKVLSFLQKTVVDVLGIRLDENMEAIPQEVTALAEERTQARADKDYTKSDELRDAITEKGYTIEDATEGYTLTKN